MSDHVRLDVTDRIATITIDRAPTNAIDREMLAALLAMFRSFPESDDIDAIILTGSGHCFSVRPDLSSPETKQFEDVYTAGLPLDHSRQLIEALLGIPQPLIVAMNGDASLVGATLALLADFLVMADDSHIVDSHVSLGLVAGDGGTLIWPWLVGINRAKHILLRSRPLDAADALSFGIAYDVQPKKEVLKESQILARELAGLDKRALRWTKYALNKTLQHANTIVGDTSLLLEYITLGSRPK